MGFTFKENVSDFRNTKVVDIIKKLQSYRVNDDRIDPYAIAEEVRHEYQIILKDQPEGTYDAIIVAVAHRQYRQMKGTYFLRLTNTTYLLVDVKGLYANRIEKLDYWSL